MRKTKQNYVSIKYSLRTNTFVTDNPKTLWSFGTSHTEVSQDFTNPGDLCHRTLLEFDESYISGHVPRYIDM